MYVYLHWRKARTHTHILGSSKTFVWYGVVVVECQALGRSFYLGRTFQSNQSNMHTHKKYVFLQTLHVKAHPDTRRLALPSLGSFIIYFCVRVCRHFTAIVICPNPLIAAIHLHYTRTYLYSMLFSFHDSISAVILCHNFASIAAAAAHSTRRPACTPPAVRGSAAVLEQVDFVSCKMRLWNICLVCAMKYEILKISFLFVLLCPSQLKILLILGFRMRKK